MDKYTELIGKPVDEATGKKFMSWQIRSIVGTMVGYALFYVVRKNLSMAIPGMEADASLDFSKADLGIFLTLNGVVYGISKFANGFLGDRINARYFMMFGLAMCAICNFVFGMSSVVWLFGLAWVLNGWFQGTGYPPCARILSHWIHPKQLATKMSIWNTSHSIGAFVSIVLCGYIVSLGWRWCFYIPAIIAILGVFAIWVMLRDTPTSVGLPEVTAGKLQDTVDHKVTNTEFKAILRKRVFGNPFIWTLAVANFFVYTVRFAFLDWGPAMLQQWLGVSPSSSGWLIGGFELFGLCGMTLAGWMTDKYLKGKAARTCLICMILTMIFVGCFWMWHSNGLPMAGSIVLLFIIGFFIYGPQALLGIAAANLATKEAAATAVGLTGLFAYASTVISGWGMGALVDHFTTRTVVNGQTIVDSSLGWSYAFGLLIIAAIIGSIILAAVWKAKADGYDD